MSKKTPFTDIHLALGAKMQEFAGYNMPIEYNGIIKEHLTVCNQVGVFDVSHMGEFKVKGKESVNFLQKITCNDVTRLSEGKAQYTCFINENGGIVDDLIIYCINQEEYLLVVNASNIEKDWQFCLSHKSEDILLENISDEIALLAIQGPKALDTLQQLTSLELSTLTSYQFRIDTVAGVEDVLISNTGYTGAGGFELYFRPEAARQIWDALFSAGNKYGIQPIGLGARDTLRLEMGYCLYGNELNDSTTPLEAGLGWITKFNELNHFIGREVLEKQKLEGVKQKLVAFKLTEKGIPRHDYEIVDSEGNTVGKVTSGSISPTLQQGIGLAYIQASFPAENSPLFIKIRNKSLNIQLARLPFRKTIDETSN